MATENQGWDTSTAHIRRTLEACIEHGRRAGGREGADLWEAYRLLGTALHTLEDLLAHSNWCEIALRKMGHAWRLLPFHAKCLYSPPRLYLHLLTVFRILHSAQQRYVFQPRVLSLAKRHSGR